jgi:hypothetical protein
MGRWPSFTGNPRPKVEIFLELGLLADITSCILTRTLGKALLAEERAMTSSVSELDLIEELRLRRWARENYVPRSKRQMSWHPVVHDEMKKKDDEGSTESEQTPAYYAWLKS